MQYLVIVLCAAVSGWFIVACMIKILFWPLTPLKIGNWKWVGIVPGMQREMAIKAGIAAQKEFLQFNGLEEKLTDPLLLARLRPVIEQHIDHFLQHKIKQVFPLLAQFMGEKTINQFKSALLTEIDGLFPELMKNYSKEIKSELRLDHIIEQKLMALDPQQMKKDFYMSAGSQLNKLKLAGTFIGIFSGLLTVLILFLCHILT